MGVIHYRRKWNIETGQWEKSIDDKYMGRCFAFAKYNDIINNQYDKTFNYIIIANGGRVEDRTKNYTEVDEKQLHIDYMIKCLSEKNKNYRIRMFMMDADAPIIEDAKLIAKYFDEKANSHEVNTINFLGMSKCAAMGFYIPSFFHSEMAFNKSNFYLIATPYIGTKLASPLVIYKEIEELCSKLSFGHNTKISEKITRKIIKKYESISSNSHMDYDIAIAGGVPRDKSFCYDPKFVENMFRIENISSMKKVNIFINVVTYIDKYVKREALKDKNLRGVFLCVMNDLLFEGKSDGMVYTSTQEELYNHMSPTRTLRYNTHHEIFSNKRVMRDLLNIVESNIID